MKIKGKKRVFFIIIVFLLTITAGAYLYVQSREFNEHLKSIIKTTLSDYAGREVKVERISTDIFNRTIISGVRIMDDERKKELISINRIKLSYSLIELFRNIRDPERIISSVTFYGPSITIDATGEKPKIPGLEKMNSGGESKGLPSWTLRVVRGNAHILLPGEVSYHITSCNGSVFLGGYPELHSRTEFRIEELDGSVNVRGDVNVISGDFSGTLNLNKIKVSDLRDLFPTETAQEFPSANLDASLRFTGNTEEIKRSISSLYLYGDMHLRAATWKEFTVPYAKVNISPRRLLVEEGSVGWKNNSLSIRGTIENYLVLPDMDIQLGGTVDTYSALKEIGVDAVQGIAEVEGEFKGTAYDHRISGSVFMEKASIGKRKVSKIEIDLNYKEDVLQILSGEFEAAGGRLLVSGSLSASEEIDVRGRIENMALMDIALEDALKGSVDGDISMSGSWEDPFAEIDFSFMGVSAGYKDFGDISLKAEYSSGRISLDGFSLDGKYSLSGSSFYDTQSKTLSEINASINSSEGEGLNVQGEIQMSPARTSLRFKGENIFAGDLPVLRDIYSSGSGTFGFDGSLETEPGKLFIESSVTTRNFRLDDVLYSLDGELSALLKDNGKRFYNARINNLNDYLKGMVELEFSDGKYRLGRASADFSRADLAQLAVLLGSPEIITGGYMRGYAEYSEDKRRGEVEIERPSFYGSEFDSARTRLSFAGNAVNLVSMVLESGPGRAEFTGEVYPEQNINMFVSNFDLYDRIMSFTGKYSGAWSSIYNFTASAEDIVIDGWEFDDIELSGESDEKEFKINFESKPSITASLTAGSGPEGKLSGNIDIKDIDASAVADTAGLSHEISGALNGKVEISGTKRVPEFSYTSRLSDGRFEGVSISLESYGHYSPGILRLDEIKGSIGENGNLSASGSYENEKLDFSYSVKNFSVPEHLKDNISALIDIEGNIGGSRNDIKIDYNKQARDIKTAGLSAKSFSSHGRYSGKELIIESGRIGFDTGALSILSGTVSSGQGKMLDLILSIRLENLRAGPAALLGRASVKGYINPETVDFKADISPETLIINRYRVDKPFTIQKSDRKIQLRAREGIESDIKLLPDSAIEIESIRMRHADVRLAGDGFYSNGSFNGSFEGRGIEINNIMRLLNSESDIKGRAAINIQLNADDSGLKASGNINIPELSYRELELNNINSRFTYDSGEVYLEETHIRDPRYIDLSAAGKLGDDSDFEIKINRLSLSVLESISREITHTSGYFQGEFAVKGEMSDPRIEGYAELVGGSLRGESLFDEISRINCRISADGSRLVVENMKARWAPGSVSAEGYMDFSSSPFEVDILVNTEGDRGVNIRVPYLDIPQSAIFGRQLNLPSQGEPSGSFRFYTEGEEKHIKGDILLSNAHFTYPPAQEIQAPETPDASFLDEVYLKIKLTAGRAVWYENTFARARASGSLIFEKEPSGPLLVNGVMHSDQGNVNFFNRDFRVREVRVIFEDGREYIEGTAATTVRRRIDDDIPEDDEIEMRISRSRIADMEPQFSSARFAEITTSREATELAMAGARLEDLTSEERNMLMRRELLRAIDANLTSPLVQNILRQADIVDVAKVDIKFEEDPELEALQLRGAGLRLGRHLTDRFYMGYYIEYGAAIHNPLRLSHELDMSYRMRESQFLRGRISDEEQFLGIEQRFRF